MSGIREALGRGAARASIVLVAACLAVGASALQGDARPKAPPVVTPPPPPAPPPPILGVGLNERMLNDAAAFQAYIDRVTAISPAFHDGPAVATALRTGAAYEPGAFLRGAAAYGALAALREPTFVAAVRAAGPNANARRVVLNRLIAEPGYVFTFAGAAQASLYVKEAIGGQGVRLIASGKAVQQSAYDVQHSAWSKDPVIDPTGRLTAVKMLSASAPPAAPDVAAALRDQISGPAMSLPTERTVAYQTPLVAKAMALAAFAALGEAGDAAYDRLLYLTSEGNTALCLSMAKLNLNQCLAVAKPHYEDIFCLGKHVMMDTGVCLAKGGGGVMALEVRTQPMKLTPPRGAAARPPARRGRR
jgi:hypothetical protein